MLDHREQSLIGGIYRLGRAGKATVDMHAHVVFARNGGDQRVEQCLGLRLIFGQAGADVDPQNREIGNDIIAAAAVNLGLIDRKAGTHSGMMGSTDMKQSMKAGMDNMQNMKMSGDTDKDFAMMMKMHHQQALDMAEMQLAHGKSAELKTMATKIIAGQKKEIAQFDRWLAKQK